MACHGTRCRCRRDLPPLLTTASQDALPPQQAVDVLNARMKHVSQLNAHIADWLQDRRRVEEAYVQGLRKLANRRPPDDSSDLGYARLPACQPAIAIRIQDTR